MRSSPACGLLPGCDNCTKSLCESAGVSDLGLTRQQEAPAGTQSPQTEVWNTDEERSGNQHQKGTHRRCGSGAFTAFTLACMDAIEVSIGRDSRSVQS
jgi:hypothetical protein